MGKHADEVHLARCLELLEAKLNRGVRSDWSNYDFERLIEDIHGASGIRLSLTTLKRVSGRVKYGSFPTHTTLNALARYIEFKDWRDFVQHEELSLQRVDDAPPRASANPPPVESSNPLLSTETKHKKPGGFRRVMWAAVAVPLLLAVYLLIASRKKQNLDSSRFSFRADKVYSVGVPNSVVFHYDATGVPSDSVFIVQTWDLSRKTLVAKDKHEHSAIYYYPGYFQTKLIVDGEVVKTHPLQIASDGWLCLAEQQPRPVYFSKDEVEHGDSVTVGVHTLEKYNLLLHPEPPVIRFFNQGDLGSLMNDNFTFEVQLKNPFNEGSNSCQFVEVLIQCKDDIIIIPLSAKACIGDLNLYVCGFGIGSKQGDLSGFGCDLSDWVTLRVVTRNKHMKLIVNGKTAYELDFPNDPTGIVGVQYRFHGPASVRGTRFESGNEVYALQPAASTARSE
ncbi:MAG TPA: hypothetical protein VK658_16890 [Chryseolinea sp.]|nr:hypothetical protein [Chryseolinea sp.]